MNNEMKRMRELAGIVESRPAYAEVDEFEMMESRIAGMTLEDLEQALQEMEIFRGETYVVEVAKDHSKEVKVYPKDHHIAHPAHKTGKGAAGVDDDALKALKSQTKDYKGSNLGRLSILKRKLNPAKKPLGPDLKNAKYVNKDLDTHATVPGHIVDKVTTMHAGLAHHNKELAKALIQKHLSGPEHAELRKKLDVALKPGATHAHASTARDELSARQTPKEGQRTELDKHIHMIKRLVTAHQLHDFHAGGKSHGSQQGKKGNQGALTSPQIDMAHGQDDISHTIADREKKGLPVGLKPAAGNEFKATRKKFVAKKPAGQQ